MIRLNKNEIQGTFVAFATFGWGILGGSVDSPKLVEECISVKLKEEVPIVGKKTRYSPSSIAKNRKLDLTGDYVSVNGRYIPRSHCRLLQRAVTRVPYPAAKSSR